MSSNTFTQAKSYINGILKKNPAIDGPLDMLSKTTNFDKETLFAAMCLTPILLILAFFDFGLVVDLLGFAYPFVKSIEALKTEGLDDDSQWLTYWIIYNFFKMLEGPFDSIISFVPFYHIFKASFLVWCYYPTSGDEPRGATKLYTTIILPYVTPIVEQFLAVVESGKKVDKAD